MGHSASISPANFIEALSLALDLASDGLSSHQTRTAVISCQIGRELGLNQEELKTLTYASFLHDIGASAHWDERQNLHEFQQAIDAYGHAETGYKMLVSSQYFGHAADIIRHHHDRYDGGNPSGVAREGIPLLSRILFLSGGVDVMQKQNVEEIFDVIPQIIRCIQKASNSYFDPVVVEAFLKIAKHEGFWLDIQTGAYHTKFIRELKFNGKIPFASEGMLHIAGIFASLVDSISKFTFHHSHNVAAVAEFLAASRGFNEGKIRLHKLAGLLHDLGKLAVPNKVLEKPGKLSLRECFEVKRHPYFTLRILQRIEGFGAVAEWAGHHHEMPNGLGYPFGLKGKELSIGARIIAVADVYSALNEDRPYRAPVEQGMIIDILRNKAKAGELDVEIVADLISQCDAARTALQHSAVNL